MSFEFDMLALLRRSGADIAMFLTAMLVYWILHHVKSGALQRKTSGKESCDQECPSDSSDLTVYIQPKQAVSTKQEAIPCGTNSAPHHPKLQAHHKSKVSQQKPVLKIKPFNVTEELSLMRNHAASRNIKETLQAFRLIQQNKEPVTSAMHNTVLQAWINCGNIWAAENCLEEMTEAGLVDETSFVILVKALLPIGDIEKARALLEEMKEKVPLPSAATMDELLLSFARAGLLHDGISLLKHMHTVGVAPTAATLCAIAKLVNGARFITERSHELAEVLSKFTFDSKCVDEVSQKYPSELPGLVDLVFQSEEMGAKICIHGVEIKGSLSEIDGLCVTLKQHDFKSMLGASPLEVQRDAQQDVAKRAQVAGALRAVSRQGLGLPWNVEEVMLQYLGSEVHFLRLNFQSNSMRAPMVDELSCRHPRLGFRHCWVKAGFGTCGQRTISNGEEIDESSFNRHINAGYTRKID